MTDTFTFAAVNTLAFAKRAGSRVVTGLGALSAGAATLMLVYQLALDRPWALASLAALVLLAAFARPWILRRFA